ncbi:MAG: basic amino acid ABC transporter substrate-binding protein [Oscillospiraceae bacterium]|nr:basic amino acid ABC transporter substrate-binding protein [Oscillospiraceae bacterium]
MKKLLALCLACLMLAPVAALAEPLILGTECSFPPFEYIGDDGQPAGFDIEIGKLIAAKLGRELVVEDMAFDGLLMALDAGKIDLAIAAMTITEEKQQQVDFSQPYFDAQQQVVVRKGYTDIKALADIADKAVAVQEGTTGHTLASEDLLVPADKIAAFKNAADAILELKTGRVDCVIIDTAPAKVYVAQNDDLEILPDIQTELEQYGVAIKKGNVAILDAANAVLEEAKTDGTYDKLVAAFFP